MLTVPMSAMEEMQQWAGEQESVRQQAEQMPSVLRIEQENSDQRG